MVNGGVGDAVVGDDTRVVVDNALQLELAGIDGPAHAPADTFNVHADFGKPGGGLEGRATGVGQRESRGVSPDAAIEEGGP